MVRLESTAQPLPRLLALWRLPAVAFGLLVLTALPAKAEPAYAIAMHGAPALPADFTHMPYANPDAPKGGRLVQGLPGTFDSLNPLIVRASPCSKSGALWLKV